MRTEEYYIERIKTLTYALGQAEVENERLDDALREILDIAEGWHSIKDDTKKMRLIYEIGSKVIVREELQDC